MTIRSLAIAALFLAATATTARAETPDADLVARGAYLGRITDCAGCHMPRDADGHRLEPNEAERLVAAVGEP